MGLSINNYSRSYSTLQALREEALKAEKNPLPLNQVYGKDHENTGYPQFIHHSDCDGGYISFKKFGINQKNIQAEPLQWGNLDQLKTEVEDLNIKFEATLPDHLKESWECFYMDVTQENEVLIFN